MCAALGTGIVAFARGTGAIGGDAADLLTLGDLAEKVGQDRRGADMAFSDLDGPDRQRLLVDAEVDLKPDAPLRAAMLAGVPLAFTLDLDARAIDQPVQRPLHSTIRDVHGGDLLAARQRAEAGPPPIEADQVQQACDAAGCLLQGHAEQDLPRQAGLAGGIAAGRLSAAPACRHAIPAHGRVEPDRQRTPAPERAIVGGQFLVLQVGDAGLLMHPSGHAACKR